MFQQLSELELVFVAGWSEFFSPEMRLLRFAPRVVEPHDACGREVYLFLAQRGIFGSFSTSPL